MKDFTPLRIASIDILRALTMILMIFVNDLWSLREIPQWLEHVAPGVDGIGLADVVFPAFLFIVGLSIPFALDHRRAKADSAWQLINHVLLRTIALLVMGVFLVNGETLNESAMGLPRYLWNSICCFCFILIWNSYPRTLNSNLVYGAKGIAIIALLVLAFIYRGGEEGNIQRFAPQWWGILGLIGWAYLASGLITVFAKNKFHIILSVWIFFCALSMLSHAGLIPELFSFIPDAIRGGTLTGLTMGGVLTSLIFQRFRNRGDNRTMTLVLISLSVLLIIPSVITRPYWGLAKLGATPAWLFLCSAFTILALVVIYWLVDVRGKANWFAAIKPAGTDTLLCYLIPYFVYTTQSMFSLHLPEMMLVGSVGLLKSFLFALLCVAITGLLNRFGVRLKL
jgi:heparan-alpha-glucosaminide N-acetyltransferase